MKRCTISIVFISLILLTYSCQKELNTTGEETKDEQLSSVDLIGTWEDKNPALIINENNPFPGIPEGGAAPLYHFYDSGEFTSEYEMNFGVPSSKGKWQFTEEVESVSFLPEGNLIFGLYVYTWENVRLENGELNVEFKRYSRDGLSEPLILNKVYIKK